jgi:hypothetical protein
MKKAGAQVPIPEGSAQPVVQFVRSPSGPTPTQAAHGCVRTELSWWQEPPPHLTPRAEMSSGHVDPTRPSSWQLPDMPIVPMPQALVMTSQGFPDPRMRWHVLMPPTAGAAQA